MPVDIRCPQCGSETVVRTAKKGPNAGQRFHVCINYPDCKGKVPASRLSLQQRKQIDELEWLDEKSKAYAYKAEEGFDPNLIKEVYDIWNLHNEELNETLYGTIQQQRGSLVRAFIKNLEHEWPKECSEIRIEKVAEAIRERVVKSIDMAYIAGYMFCKGWISIEQLTEFNLCLGDNLAHDIRSVWKRAKSRGIAFATAFGVVGVHGTLAAQAASETSMPTHEPSKHEVIEKTPRREGTGLPRRQGKVPIKKQIDAERPFKGKEVKTTGKRKVVIGILLVPIAFPLMGAIPGAIIGLITGLFGFHLIAAIVIGIFIFITYPRSRRRWGSEPDLLTYFFALCGAAGGGFACYFVGNLLQ